MKEEFKQALKLQEERIKFRLEEDMKEMIFYTPNQRTNYIEKHNYLLDVYLAYIITKIRFFSKILPESDLKELQEFLELDDNINCSGFYDFIF